MPKEAAAAQTKHAERMILPNSSQKYVPQSTQELGNKSDFVEPLQVHDHACLLSSYLMIASPPQIIMMTINHINVYNAWHNNINGTSEASNPAVKRNRFLVQVHCHYHQGKTPFLSQHGN